VTEHRSVEAVGGAIHARAVALAGSACVHCVPSRAAVTLRQQQQQQQSQQSHSIKC